ncbi:MAG: type II CAAX prenyl endopeptidase Rce1 family protein [Opitutales bacterium]
MDNPLIASILYAVLGAAVLTMWIADLRRPADGRERFWPGATRCGWLPVLLATGGVVVLTVIETLVEDQLGLRQQQTVIADHFLLAMLGASIVEEMTFRGFAAPADLAGWKLIAVALVGSLAFAAFHGFGISDTKGLVSTGSAFAVSLWLYLSRFNALNPSRSMIPSLVGHATRNLAVFGVKAAQGYVAWS